MKYHLTIFGCQMNRADAERIRTVMEHGFENTQTLHEADIAIIVACSVRQHAIDRLFSFRKKFEAIKKSHPLISVLTGCVLDSDKKKIAEFFDIILDINKIYELPLLLKKKSFIANEYLSIRPAYENNFQAYVPISNGCNQFCHFCVVPYTRGREVYRDPDDIMQECENLIKNGYKEITLLGQTVNSYAHPKADFSKLLEKLDFIQGDWWLRFVSSHPNFFTREIIKVWERSSHIVPYLHLAVQSGDNSILCKMNRRYTVEKYKKIIREIRKAIPHISISTDVIVGYSDETEENFQNTVNLFKEIEFEMAYISKYSPRQGTLGAKIYEDNVPWQIKKERGEKLNDVLGKIALEKNKEYIGKSVRVLIEKQENGCLFGKTAAYKTTKIKSKKLDPRIGQFIDVKVIDASSWGLLAEA